MNPWPVLLYDGDCGFCQATVQFVLRRDREKTLRFAPLQGEFAAALRARFGELEAVDSVVWVPAGGEGVLLRSDAAFAVARYLGGAWRLLPALAVVPRAIRDRVYDAIAARRHRLAERRACLLPAAEDRARFIP
ncbi:MAG: DUF393 domain-containing protein [Gemmatimonadetes bacterium]|nr:DUF393 domain-containing protein [Gemmatimonadota bacterium]